MRRVFSSNELSEIVLVRDALVHRGFEVSIQNQHSGIAPIPEFRPAADIWVHDDEDYERARKVVLDTLSTLDGTSNQPHWLCSHCGEDNPGSFGSCWNCEREKSGDS